MCDDMIGLKKGIFSTRYSFIQYRKFQYITFYQNILEKKLNIMKGNITILAALSQFQNSIPYMTQQDCQLLYEKFMKNLR